VPDLDIADLTIEYTSGGYVIRPIDGLDLRAGAGSLTLLLGPSGSGKTSLLSCIGGILSPKSGRIRFGDVEVTTLRGRAATDYRRRAVGIVFQAFNLVPSLTAMENVLVPLWAAGVGRRQARARAGALLEQVGLSDRAGHRPGALSGGQRQRVAVARALALDPPLVLADEPTAYLDYIQVESVLRLLRDLAGGDRMVVVATHDQRLLPLADRAVELVPHVSVSGRPPERVALTAGEVLFRQGSWGELIYVVEEGVVELVAELADGAEELRSAVTSGKYFGEIGPLFAMPRSATARARTAAVVVGYSARDFRQRIGNGRVATAMADAAGASMLAAVDGGPRR
jgi:putative ABC transport system ATP-binding protein